MKESRSYILQGVWMLAAAGMLVGAGLLQFVLDPVSREAGLAAPGGPAAAAGQDTSALTLVPGGFRAPILAALWIRAEDLKNQGKYYDALQLARTICQLEPHFSGPWLFMAWNMSYNISVGTHTLEHRWLWVYNGIKLLRDEGIPANPQSINLYRELAWIYYHKIGGFMDDFHAGYKARWAGYMQRLLAPPPYGEANEVIAAFRSIAQAPLDRDPQRQGRQPIQKDKLGELLADPACAEYARLLGQRGVTIDANLLDAYNRFSLDENIQAIQPAFGGGREDLSASPEANAVSDLINSPRHAGARGRLLAFVRAQLLWNQYRMDPRWMLGLMEKYGPLDWRLPWSHALYWATYGFHAAEGTPLESIERIEALNNSRNIVFALKDLTWQGRVTLELDPNNPDVPLLWMFADPRFVEPAQKEYVRLIEKATADRHGETPEENAFRAGHINYISDCVAMLHALYRREEAWKYLQYLKEMYKLQGGEWDSADVEEFVIRRLSLDKEPGRDVALSQISPALRTGYVLMLQSDAAGSRAMIRWAQRVHEMYQRSVPQRNWLPPFEEIAAREMAVMLVRPRALGYNLPLQSRSQLYRQADGRIQDLVYPMVAPALRVQCQAEGMDFNRAFPRPR